MVTDAARPRSHGNMSVQFGLQVQDIVRDEIFLLASGAVSPALAIAAQR